MNSTGGAAGSSTPCGTLFTNTTPASTYTATPVTPTNTLQAMLNLAKFPFTGTTALYGLTTSTGYYQPSLTAAPPDFSIAIIYRSYGSGSNQIGSAYYVTTDINDNVYETGMTATSTGTSTGTTPVIANALSSNGVGNWTGPAGISSNATNVCSAYAGTAATSAPCEAATDTAGNLWFALGSLNTGFTGGLYQISQASGATTLFNTTFNSMAYYPYAVAVDANNDVFYTTSINGGDNLFKLAPGATATAAPTAVSTGGAVFQGAHLSDSIVFDTAGDIFAPIASGSNVGFNYIANTGTLSAEAFATTANQCNCLGSTQGTDKWPTGGMIDASGNYWMTGQNGLYEIAAGATNAQNVTGGGSTGVNNVAIGSAATTTLRISSMDGAGTIFVPDSSTAGAVNPTPPPAPTVSPVLRLYYTTLATSAQAAITGCNTGGVTTSTACITANNGAPNNQLFYQALNPVVDSTGSIWVSSEGNDAVIQVLGMAAPTWPQASYLHPSVMPQ